MSFVEGHGVAIGFINHDDDNDDYDDHDEEEDKNKKGRVRSMDIHFAQHLLAGMLSAGSLHT